METRKQIENNLRNKIAKQYKTAIDYLTEKLKLRTEALVKKGTGVQNSTGREQFPKREDVPARRLDPAYA